MDILQRPIAITDVETTGLDSAIHEIIEIGLVLVNQETLEIVDTLDIKVRPECLETASEFSLQLNGYNEREWQNALSLHEAMSLYSEKTKDAIFCAHNITFDWSFISEAFKKINIKNSMEYHRLDLFTMSWLKLKDSGLESFHLKDIAKYLGIPEEPMPHRAINGAKVAYEIFKKLA